MGSTTMTISVEQVDNGYVLKCYLKNINQWTVEVYTSFGYVTKRMQELFNVDDE